jgi:two-component system sensor histidine kinase DesK
MDATRETCTVISVSPLLKTRTRAEPRVPSGERALRRMRIYTSISLGVVVLMFFGLTVLQTTSTLLLVMVIVTTIAVTAYSMFWEKGAPLWLTLVALGTSLVSWVTTVVMHELPGTIFLLAVTFAVYAFTERSAFGQGRSRWVRPLIVGLLISAAPVVLVSGLPLDAFVPPSFAAIGLAFFATFGLFGLNRFGFNLYLEIDAARRVGAELAVVQERYRFASDLHDIQGQTLHVIRLKTQLADKLLDRDPAAAHEHLREAQQLITETLAGTRSLAFGDRHVALASELANAEALLTAADIEWRVDGTLPLGPHDELFALVVREATTNILRHAQASRVSVTLEPGSVTVTNDGSPATSRSLSGLARLGERFEAAGGALRTASADGIFTTTASIG